jgi:hypothetical protein
MIPYLFWFSNEFKTLLHKRCCQQNFAKRVDKYTWRCYYDCKQNLAKGSAIMDRNDILEKSRKENRNMDEREKDALAKAGQKATAVGGVVCVFIILFEAIVSDFVSFSTWAVYLSMTGTTLLVKYSILRRKHELLFGLLQLALAIIFIGIYIKRMVG